MTLWVYPALKLLHGFTIFTKLDLRNIYHLLSIRVSDDTLTGHYLIMCFSLANAPTVFHSLVNNVLQDMLNQFASVYLDGILIFSETREEYTHQVQSVLQNLLKNSLYVKAEKSESHTSTVSFLGYIPGVHCSKREPP